MPKERNKADGYREKAYEGDTKAMNRMLAPMVKPLPRLTGMLKGMSWRPEKKL